MMLNNRLFWFLCLLCLMLPTTYAVAQEPVEADFSLSQSVMPPKQPVEQQQVLTDASNQLLVPSKQSIEPQEEAQQQASESALTQEPQEEAQQQASVLPQAEASQKLEQSQIEAQESNVYEYVDEFSEDASLGYRKALNAFYQAVRYEDCESLEKFVHPKKPVLLMARTYNNEGRSYTSSDSQIRKLFANKDQSTMFDVLFDSSDLNARCQSSTCSKPGMHFSSYTDHFVWDEKSQKLFWVATVYEAFWGEYDEEEDRDKLYELRSYDEELNRKFYKTLKKYYGRELGK